jgi:hypothetical protein
MNRSRGSRLYRFAAQLMDLLEVLSRVAYTIVEILAKLHRL